MVHSKTRIEELDDKIKASGGADRKRHKVLPEEVKDQIKKLRNQKQAQNTRKKQREMGEAMKIRLGMILHTFLPQNP